MNILLINGSPKGKNSNTLRLAESFLEGVCSKLQENGSPVSAEAVDASSLKIGSCKGCFACWKVTPGVCCIKDDMPDLLKKLLDADLVIWSFPLYYFNVPGMLKNLIDRQLPLIKPFMSENTSGYGSGGHDMRYESKGTKHVLISTCGFYSAKGNYDSVRNMFDHFLGKNNYETIFCGQGELFHIKDLAARTNEYLETVKKAGTEYADGAITEATHKQLETLLFPKEIFEKMADASWGIDKETGKKDSEDYSFTKQMAALYNKNSYDGKDRVLEMHYTDLGTTYQILLGKEGCEVFRDGHLTATTRIETPYEVWKSISQGEIEGAEALGKGLYTVTGDFSLMINWDKFFIRSYGSTPETTVKNPSMASMLIPWISFWIATGINEKIGPLVSLSVCALIPLIMRKYKLIFWDQLSIAAVAILSVITNITGKGHLTIIIAYIIFGAFWLISCATKEPLCAAYVKAYYGGDKAHKNPLFMKTNYILAACWGILYLLSAVWTYFLGRAGFGHILIIINNMVPMLMGLFTLWFQKWYPAHMASRKRLTL